MNFTPLKSIISLYPSDDDSPPIFITELRRINVKASFYKLTNDELIWFINLFFNHEPKNQLPILRCIMTSILKDELQESACEDQLNALACLVKTAPLMLIVYIDVLKNLKFSISELKQLSVIDIEIPLEKVKYPFNIMEELINCSTLDECIRIINPTMTFALMTLPRINSAFAPSQSATTPQGEEMDVIKQLSIDNNNQFFQTLNVTNLNPCMRNATCNLF